MTVSTCRKDEIARSQLEVALRLEADGVDLFAVITLAGAAEELLGRLVEEAGGQSAFASMTNAAVQLQKILGGTTADAKEFANRANRAKNSLKHHTPGQIPEVTCDFTEEAADLLDRAISNWWVLKQTLTPAMQAFVLRQRAT